MCLPPIQMIRKLKEGSESCLSLLEVIRAKTFFFERRNKWKLQVYILKKDNKTSQYGRNGLLIPIGIMEVDMQISLSTC